MNIRIKIGRPGEEDVVILRDRSRWNWSAWLASTESAVKAVRAAIDGRTITREAADGHAWLRRCGVTSNEQFQDLEQHLPQLRQPMGASNSRRCQKCGHRIWGKMALLTRLGSDCRRGNPARRAVRQMRAWMSIQTMRARETVQAMAEA